MRLQDKVVVITGAQQGIGAATALQCAREGARVVINYLDDEPAAASLSSEINRLGASAVTVAGDVSRPEQVRGILEAAAALGGADVLVNNAGIFPRCTLLELSEAQWDRVIDVNLKGTFLCSQAAAAQMIAKGGGSIVNISSIVAFAPDERGAHYTASKAGVIGLTRALAMELPPTASGSTRWPPGSWTPLSRATG